MRSGVRALLAALVALTVWSITPSVEAGSLRFRGQPIVSGDRVEIRLDGPARPIDVGGDFTIEFWLRALPGSNPVARPCAAARDEWIWGNIVLDRDVYGDGDHGDYGVSLMRGRIAFGVSRGAVGATACGATDLRDGIWHHVAVVREVGSGQLRIFVDGRLDGAAVGPAGDLSYRDGRVTGWPFDPFLVIGNEKHFGPDGFDGWLSMLRVSNAVRYTSPFVRPGAPFVVDPATAALYRFDEGAGSQLGDDSGAAGGPSHGLIRFGGAPISPEWSSDDPFTVDDGVFGDDFESSLTFGLAGVGEQGTAGPVRRPDAPRSLRGLRAPRAESGSDRTGHAVDPGRAAHDRACEHDGDARGC